MRLGAVLLEPAHDGDLGRRLEARLRRLHVGGQQMRVGREGHGLGRVGVIRLHVWLQRVLRILQLRRSDGDGWVGQHELDAIDVGAAGLHIEIDEAEQGPLGLPHHLGVAAVALPPPSWAIAIAPPPPPSPPPMLPAPANARQRIQRVDHPRTPVGAPGPFSNSTFNSGMGVDCGACVISSMTFSVVLPPATIAATGPGRWAVAHRVGVGEIDGEVFGRREPPRRTDAGYRSPATCSAPRARPQWSKHRLRLVRRGVRPHLGVARPGVLLGIDLVAPRLVGRIGSGSASRLLTVSSG